jgi:site-specific DNA-methyltransferase (adenine-specific)
MSAPYYSDGLVTLYHGDCRDVLPTVNHGSVDVLLADPPYFQVKDEDWDRQWRKQDDFLTWLGSIVDLVKPLLMPSASVWVFASPFMVRRVEDLVGDRFRVLNSIRWVKDQGWHKKAEVEAQRRYLTPWEGIVFAEQLGASDEAWRSVFEPVRQYLNESRMRAGVSVQQVNAVWQQWRQSRGQMPGHWFSRSQWLMPTAEHYAWLREQFGAAAFDREYDDLRDQYDDLRRPFRVTADGPVTDLWTFPAVMGYPAKHPCEKPASMIRHMLSTSARPGGVVLDPFAGSCSTLRVCKELGLRGIGIESDERYCDHAAQRLSQEIMIVPDGDENGLACAHVRHPDLFEGAAS